MSSLSSALIVGKECSQFLSPGTPYTDAVAFLDLGGYLTVFTQALILVAGLGAFAYLLIGGIQYLVSGGDKVHTEAARNRISYAIMGLAVVAAAVAITYVVSTIFGVNILGNVKWPGAGTIVGDLGPLNCT